MTVEQYQQTGLQLLPQGRIWNKAADGELSDIMGAMAQMLARIDSTAEIMTNEAIASNASFLLGEYETFAGLPDCTTDEQAAIQTRRTVLTKKLTISGSLSKQTLIKQAEERGYTIRVIERHPHHCMRHINYPLYPWYNWWLAFVSISHVQSRYATVIDDITTHLKIHDDYSDLMCLLERYKPAHINLILIDNKE